MVLKGFWRVFISASTSHHIDSGCLCEASETSHIWLVDKHRILTIATSLSPLINLPALFDTAHIDRRLPYIHCGMLIPFG